MLEKEDFHPLNYIKKEEYSGSMSGMRYMLKKSNDGEADVIKVIIWPEPMNLLKTPENLKDILEVPLTADGVEQAREWLNEQYENRKEYWIERLHQPWTGQNHSISAEDNTAQ